MAAWLLDTSLWISAYGRGNREAMELIRAYSLEYDVCVCDPVELELMPGPSDERQLEQLKSGLALFDRLETTAAAWHKAKSLVFILRRKGITVAGMDALIAGIALANDAGVLHCDRDFELIAEYLPLRQLGV